jgi:hypothetical protein
MSSPVPRLIGASDQLRLGKLLGYYIFLVISVSILPGKIALTRMPCLPKFWQGFRCFIQPCLTDTIDKIMCFIKFRSDGTDIDNTAKIILSDTNWAAKACDNRIGAIKLT